MTTAVDIHIHIRASKPQNIQTGFLSASSLASPGYKVEPFAKFSVLSPALPHHGAHPSALPTYDISLAACQNPPATNHVPRVAEMACLPVFGHRILPSIIVARLSLQASPRVCVCLRLPTCSTDSKTTSKQERATISFGQTMSIVTRVQLCPPPHILVEPVAFFHAL